MAITKVIDGVSAAKALPAAITDAFQITEVTGIFADNFGVGENAIVYRLGPSGSYKVATNKDGAIVLSAFPNTALLEAPGWYAITKDATAVAAHVGYGA